MANMLLELRGGRRSMLHGKSRGVVLIGYAKVLDDEFSQTVLANMAWHLVTKSRYPASDRKYLHRIVYEHYYGPIPRGMHIDHIDRDTFNALPSNLRAVPPTVNGTNRKTHKRNTTGYRGVELLPGGKWRARLSINWKNNHLGCFDTIEEAARAVNSFHRQNYPDVALPNPGAEL